MRHQLSGLLLVLVATASACGDDETAATTSATTATSGSGGATSSAAVTASSSATGGSGGSAPASEQEAEPNDGATTTEFNDLSPGVTMEGAIGSAGDADVFKLPSTGGQLYEATLTPTSGSPLVPHLAIFDDGRDGKNPADDYVKIVRGASGAIRIQWVAMGTGGYFVTVRDARNVDGQSVGDGTFGYELRAAPVDVANATVGPLDFAATHNGTLPFPGAVQLFTFSGTAGQDVLVDMQSGSLDGRLFIVAESTGDWIARQDDRTVSDNNPLIDAPLTESGNLTLVVESIAEEPSALTYTLAASLP